MCRGTSGVHDGGEGCLSYFSTALKTHHNQGNLQKDLIWEPVVPEGWSPLPRMAVVKQA